MSKEVDRYQVFHNIRVRTSLKNDASWIQKTPYKENKNRADVREDQVVDHRPVLHTSYILSTAQKFEHKAPAEELILRNHKIETEKSFKNRSAADNDGNVDTLVNHSTAVKQEEYADISINQSNVEHSEVRVSQDIHQEDPFAEKDSAAGTERKNADAFAALAATLLPHGFSFKTDLANTSKLQDVGGGSAVHFPEVGHDKRLPEQAREKKDKVVDGVSGAAPYKTGHRIILQDSVKTFQDLLERSEGYCENGPLGKGVVKPRKAAVNNTNSAPAVKNVLRDEPGLQHGVKAARDLLAKSIPEPSTPSAVDVTPKQSDMKVSLEKTDLESPEDVVKGNAESPPTTDKARDEPALKDAPKVVFYMLEQSSSYSSTVPGVETEGRCKRVSPEKFAVKPKETVDDSKLSTDNQIMNDTSKKVLAFQDGKVTIQSTDNTVVVVKRVRPLPKSAEDYVVGLNIVDALEHVKNTDAEDVQDGLTYTDLAEAGLSKLPKTEAVPESRKNPERSHTMDIKASDSENVQHRAGSIFIKWKNALDGEPPTSEAAPEPLKDPEQSHTKDTKVSQQSGNINMPGKLKNAEENLQSTEPLWKTWIKNEVCSFCHKIIDGNVKIRLSEPLITCHPECLECGGCSKTLGDLWTPIFLHDQVIMCDVCFSHVL